MNLSNAPFLENTLDHLKLFFKINGIMIDIYSDRFTLWASLEQDRHMNYYTYKPTTALMRHCFTQGDSVLCICIT